MKSRRRNHKRFAQILVLLTAIVILPLLNSKKVEASSDTGLTNKYDYSEIQEVIDDVMGGEQTFNFNEYINQLMSGKEPFTLSAISNKLMGSIKDEFKNNIGTFASLVTIALIAALFTNMSMAFKNNQVSETGYYVTYLLLFGILISSFIAASKVAAIFCLSLPMLS